MKRYATNRIAVAVRPPVFLPAYQPQPDLIRLRQIADHMVPGAQQLAPLSVRVLMNVVPQSRTSCNSLAAQLLTPWLRSGDWEVCLQEQACFGPGETDLVLANTSVAHDAALTELLAAEASLSQSTGEAVALIGTILPITLQTIGGWQQLRSRLPVLLTLTTQLVKFLYHYGPTSRPLLRLLPSILRRTIASVLVAHRWGCKISPVLICCIMTAHTRRLLRSARLVKNFLVRNALIRYLLTR